MTHDPAPRSGDPNAGSSATSQVQRGDIVLSPPPAIPTGEELYDSIMSKIEPELVSSSLPTLNGKYKDETPDQEKARRDRYNKAFAAYDAEYATTMADLQAKVVQYRKDAFAKVEDQQRALEESELSSLEDSMTAG